MSIVNLADIKVSYQGEEIAALPLIHQLQGELQELASRLAAISETLQDLQAALLNSATLEVKVALTREDLARFRSLGGEDDGERVRKAILALIQAQDKPGASLPACTPDLASPAGKDAGPEEIAPRGRQSGELSDHRKLSTRCPVCQAPIFLPDSARDQLSLEVKCDNCGAKSLLKTKL
jgi:DNA-directed RNA polymerase subunit RPC12/RpoP